MNIIVAGYCWYVSVIAVAAAVVFVFIVVVVTVAIAKSERYGENTKPTKYVQTYSRGANWS